MNQLLELDGKQALDIACRAHPGVMAEARLGFENAPFHWEWYELEMTNRRLAIVAPREHAKSEVFSIITTSHMAMYQPGSWQALFTSSLDNADMLLERVMGTIGYLEPALLDGAKKITTHEIILANYSRITVSGAGKAIRGWHPDRIVGDDLLSDIHATTNLHRRRMEVWWKGTVAPMAHPGTKRRLGWGKLRNAPEMYYPATKIILVGTPFHQLDLLMSMKSNPIYTYRRYDAEIEPADLIPGTWAVEANDYEVAA